MVSAARATIVAVALLVARAAIAADPAPEEARKLFEAGRQAYESGRYVLAISLFEEAHRLVPRPSVVFSLGQAYRRQHFVDGDPEKLSRAIEFYRRYLGDAPEGDRREEAARYIGELELVRARREATAARPPDAPRERTQLVVFSTTPGALAAIDGGEPERVPLAVEVAPGAHRIRVTAEGYHPEEVDGIAMEGRLVPIEVRLTEKTARLTIQSPAGADLEIDGRRVGRAPLAGPLELAAGKHFVALSRRGHDPVSREIEVRRGEAVTLAVTMRPTTQRRAAYWIWGASAVALVAGGVSSLLAFDAAEDARSIRARIDAGRAISVDELGVHNDAIARHEDLTTGSYLLYAGSLTLATTALLLYLLDTPRAEAPPALRGVVVGDGGVGVSWGSRF